MTNLEKLRQVTKKMSYSDRSILNEFLLGNLSIKTDQESWNRALEAGVEYVRGYKESIERSKADYGSRALS